MPVTRQTSDQIAANDAKVREMTFLGELPKGSNWCPHPSGDGVIIVHPDHPPKWHKDDGSVQEIKP